LWIVGFSIAQQDNKPGHPIGKVSIKGDLIIMELDEGALGKVNLFDLTGHTLRFTPEGSRYRVESEPLRWDSDYGPELTGAEVSLRKFAVPFFREVVELVSCGNNRIDPFRRPRTGHPR
jgi:hypothetical protein